MRRTEPRVWRCRSRPFLSSLKATRTSIPSVCRASVDAEAERVPRGVGVHRAGAAERFQARRTELLDPLLGGGGVFEADVEVALLRGAGIAPPRGLVRGHALEAKSDLLGSGAQQRGVEGRELDRIGAVDDEPRHRNLVAVAVAGDEAEGVT